MKPYYVQNIVAIARAKHPFIEFDCDGKNVGEMVTWSQLSSNKVDVERS